MGRNRDLALTTTLLIIRLQFPTHGSVPSHRRQTEQLEHVALPAGNAHVSALAWRESHQREELSLQEIVFWLLCQGRNAPTLTVVKADAG